MLSVLRYLHLISPELHLSKYPLAYNIMQMFLPDKTSNRCQLFNDAIYSTHLKSIASKEKLRALRNLLAKEQNLLFQCYKLKLFQTIGLIAVATLVAVILSVAVENNQIVNYIYKGVIAIACSYIIYHSNQTLLEIDKYDAYKKLVKLAEFQD